MDNENLWDEHYQVSKMDDMGRNSLLHPRMFCMTITTTDSKDGLEQHSAYMKFEMKSLNGTVPEQQQQPQPNCSWVETK